MKFIQMQDTVCKWLNGWDGQDKCRNAFVNVCNKYDWLTDYAYVYEYFVYSACVVNNNIYNNYNNNTNNNNNNNDNSKQTNKKCFRNVTKLKAIFYLLDVVCFCFLFCFFLLCFHCIHLSFDFVNDVSLLSKWMHVKERKKTKIK